MYFQYFLVLLPLIVRPVLTQGPPLLDALRSSGAAQYATLIESNPFALALHLSNQVKTVFAPADSTHGLKWKRDTTPADEQRFSLQSSADLNHLRDINTQPAGVTIHTRDGTANLGGTPQKVISVPRGTPQSDMTRRDSVLPKHQSNTTLPAICSGLGNRVNIIRGEIPYNGGLIHIIDDFFTLPTTLSSTTAQTGHTTFTALTSASNLTAELDSAANLTALIPTNAAFASANTSATDPTTPSLMDAHIIPNFAGYLPYLTDGLQLLTQAGTTVTVRIVGRNFYINNARIIASNLILENGVAHVLDQVLEFTPNATQAGSTPTTVPFTGTAASCIRAYRGMSSSLILAAMLVLPFMI